MDAATKLKTWDQKQAARARGGQPVFATLEDFKDWLHEALLLNSKYLVETDCSIYPAAQLMVMGMHVKVPRAAAWVWGCAGLPAGWDLFDPHVRVKATCGNNRCVNFDHLRGLICAARKERLAA